ncbi:MAG: D-aminoacylase [Firmicutes bacterium]|nr:D-aminoacylase [Bacillota bacterium]
MYDLAIENVTILDGGGGLPFVGCIGVCGETIASVTHRSRFREPVAQKVDGSGLYAAPGFIDLHSHSDFSIRVNPLACSKVLQGVTTEVVGNCGLTAAPVKEETFSSLVEYLTNTVAISEKEKASWRWTSMMEYMEDSFSRGSSVNIAPLVGQGTIRVAVMGFSDSPPSHEETAEMLRLLTSEMRMGCFGMSTGLQYTPNSYCGIEESSTLCSVVRSFGGMYSTHMRSEGRGLLESVNEVLEVARRSGARLEISHAKAAGEANWGKSAAMISRIEQETRGGLDVAFDIYPYTAYGSSILDFIPPPYLGGGVARALDLLRSESIRREVSQMILDPGSDWENPYSESGWDRIRITSIGDPEGVRFVGKNIAEVAASLGLPETEVVVDLITRFRGRVKLVVHAMDENEMKTMLIHPNASIVSDAGAYDESQRSSSGHPHPRSFGAFARALGRYVREQGALSWQEAVRKMTSLPASRAGIHDRGRIGEGMKADLVLFDPERIRDCASFEDPFHYAEGVVQVLVNGVVTVKEGKHTGARAGRLLRRDAL